MQTVPKNNEPEMLEIQSLLAEILAEFKRLRTEYDERNSSNTEYLNDRQQ